jgi:hypothetical protein
MKPNELFILLLLSLSLISCAKTDEEEVRSAIAEAKYHLSSMDCSKAEDILDDISFQEDNADYISIFASMQACKAGYKELDVLFGGNLDNLNSASLISSLASFSSSNETAPDSADYLNLNDAITTLLGNDGTAQPSAAARNTKFGTKKSGDLSMQALYLLFVQIGKHFALYGNAGTDGGKGGNAQTFGNTCIYSYTASDAVQWVNANTSGTCAGPLDGSQGSDFLESPVSAATVKTRLCYGVVYYNNLMDILGNITLPGSDSLGDVSNIQSALAVLMSAAQAVETGVFNDDPVSTNAIDAVSAVTSQAACEAINIERIEKFYAIFLETIYQ